MGSHPPDFERLIADVAGALHERELSYMLIGGQAVLLHGAPRLTQDIDITLGSGPDAVPDVLEICEALKLRPLPSDVEDFVRSTFVLPAAAARTGVRVDFIFSTTPYERQAIERAEEVELAGIAVSFATAEDLIVHKLFAGRPRDLEDARSVVRRRGADLDWSYLERWIDEFSSVPGREDLRERLSELRSEEEPG